MKVKINCFIIVLFFSVLIISSNSFADTTVVLLPEFPVSSHDGYTNYFINKVNDSWYTLTLYQSYDVALYSSKYYFVGYADCYNFNPTEDNEWRFYGYKQWSASSGNIYTLLDSNTLYSSQDLLFNGNIVVSEYQYNNSTLDPVEKDSTVTKIGVFFGDLTDNLKSWFTSLIDTLKSIPSQICLFFDNLIDYIKQIPDSFKSLFELLFVPSDNNFSEFESILKDKFAIFYQLKDLIIDNISLDSDDKIPVFEITYNGNKYKIIDFSFYDKYRTFIHGIIILISAVNLQFWLLHNFPNIVLNQSIDKSTGEVVATVSNGRK